MFSFILFLNGLQMVGVGYEVIGLSISLSNGGVSDDI